MRMRSSVHDRLRKQQLAESERQRAEIQEFVDSLKEISKPQAGFILVICTEPPRIVIEPE